MALTGKVEGRRSSGRKRVCWMSSLKEWLEEASVKDQEAELLEKAFKQGMWQDMIASSQQIWHIEGERVRSVYESLGHRTELTRHNIKGIHIYISQINLVVFQYKNT